MRVEQWSKKGEGEREMTINQMIISVYSICWFGSIFAAFVSMVMKIIGLNRDNDGLICAGWFVWGFAVALALCTTIIRNSQQVVS